MPLSRIAASSISTGSITGTQIANNTIPIEEFANTGLTAVYSSAANTVAIRTSGTDRVITDNTGAVLIGTTTKYASSGAQLLVVGGGAQFSPANNSSEGVRIQREAGFATLSGINNNNNQFNGLKFLASGSEGITLTTGNFVGIRTASPAADLDVNAETTYQNGVMRKNGVNSFQSINRRVRVELSNYAYCRFRLFALRTNSDNSTVYWEGILNNNFNTSYSTAFNSRTSSGTISYSFGTSSSGVWNWDFNNSGSGAILWYTLESPGYGTVTMTTW